MAAPPVEFVSAQESRVDDHTRENTVRSIRARGGVIELELYSSEGFALRAQRPILRIGDKEFTRSRYPADGGVDRLVFILTEEEFAALPDDADLTVRHGGRAPPTDGTRFGKLNKSLLSRD